MPIDKKLMFAIIDQAWNEGAYLEVILKNGQVLRVDPMLEGDDGHHDPDSLRCFVAAYPPHDFDDPDIRIPYADIDSLKVIV